MAKISHFVVTYNHETGEFELDNDTADARFAEGLIFDDDLDEWIETSMEDVIDCKATEKLLEVLRELRLD